MQRKQAYFTGALLIFGSAMWAAMFSPTATLVILLMALPSLIGGYIYATALPHYIWGLLLGMVAYMGVEYLMYGPIYKVTGLVYGTGFIVSVACAILACSVYRFKAKRLLAS